MALSKTNLHGSITGTSGSFGTGGYTTSAFTPPDDSLLVISVGAIEDGGINQLHGDLTISGGGLTYSVIVSGGAGADFSTGLVTWTAPVTTGASMSLTIDCAARSIAFYAVSVVAYTGYNTSSPIGGTAFGFLDASPPGPPTPASITLNATPASTSEVYAAVAINKNTNDTTPGVDFVELYDFENTDWGGQETQTRTGSTSTTVSWVDLRPNEGALFNWVAEAIEIKATAIQVISPFGIDSEFNAGNPVSSFRSNISSIQSAEVVGNPTVVNTGALVISPHSIASAQELGFPYTGDVVNIHTTNVSSVITLTWRDNQSVIYVDNQGDIISTID